MSLLSTAAALTMLEEAADGMELDETVTGRLDSLRGLFDEDLAYVEEALVAASADGQKPSTDAAQHLLLAGGKRIRPLTVLLSAACFGPVPAVARELAVVAELVHSATLLHDDVVDDSPDRRGRPTARRVFGNAVSVLAGDLLLTHALDRTASHAPTVLPDLLVTLRRLVDGEVIQLRGRSQVDSSETTYFRILESKTASLFGWSARAGATIMGAGSAAREALGTFGERLGVAFQLVDDVLDYAGDPAETGKAILADLIEGKMTLPLVLAIEKRPQLLDDVVEARLGDGAAALRVGAVVRACGVCDEVRARAENQTRLAMHALSCLSDSPARRMLAVVARELTARSR